MNFILTIIALAFFLAKSADFIYLFQTKEYRFDRFKSLLRETGYFNLFYLRATRLPAKSARNLLLAVGVLICAIFYGYEFYSLGLDQSVTSGLVALLAAPITAYFTVAGLVLLTEILARRQRRKVIDQAQSLIQNSKASFIGITGSYGKSSTKEFLFQLLAHKFKVGKTEANMNTTVGVAKSILRNLKPDTQFFIVEMGAYKQGEISEICQLTPPIYGILTALGNQHVDLFGSRHKLMLGKKELLNWLPETGKAYVNKSITEYKELTSDLKAHIVSFSADPNAAADMTIVDVLSEQPITATAQYKDILVKFTTHILGKHNLSNLLPCIALALDLGMIPTEISRALEDLKQPDNKLSLQHTRNGVHMFLDNYNTSVEGFHAALDVLALQSEKNKIIVSKGIIELGSEKEHSYRTLLKHINHINGKLITTDQLFSRLDTSHNVIHVANEKLLETALKPYLNNETILLVEGKFTASFINSLREIDSDK